MFAATGNGIARISDDGEVDVVLDGTGSRCVAAADGRVYAGGPRGLHDGDGRLLLAGDVFSVAVGSNGTLWAGTEPSRLFRSDDAAATWRELESLQELPSKPRWSFPPRPWTSHVRWIAPSPHDGETVLVGIELGGVMRTTDGGETWADHRPGAQLDCHSLAWHPRERGRAYETAGGGAAWSDDGGETWTAADDGRDRHYAWALAVDPADPDRWWCSASTGPRAAHGGRDAEARIYRWEGEWRPLTEPLRAMPYALLCRDGMLFAGFADGVLRASGDGGESWSDVAFLPSIVALAA